MDARRIWTLDDGRLRAAATPRCRSKGVQHGRPRCAVVTSVRRMRQACWAAVGVVVAGVAVACGNSDSCPSANGCPSGWALSTEYAYGGDEPVPACQDCVPCSSPNTIDRGYCFGPMEVACFAKGGNCENPSVGCDFPNPADGMCTQFLACCVPKKPPDAGYDSSDGRARDSAASDAKSEQAGDGNSSMDAIGGDATVDAQGQ
jgi:hypothetical protein